MIVIVSPTKTMHEQGKQQPCGIPMFAQESKKILEKLKELDMQAIQTLMKVNETIAEQNFKRYQAMRFDHKGTCALELYDGLAFKYMQADAYSQKEKDYVQEHVRILSGFYGVLRPFDSIYPYRLEMQCKLEVDGYANLYAFWHDQLAQALINDVLKHQDQHIINLTSKEYEKACKPYIPSEQWVDIVFQVEKEGKRKIEATAAKMARGRMIQYLALNKVETLEEIKAFHDDGYCFDQEASTAQRFVFYKVVVK